MLSCGHSLSYFISLPEKKWGRCRHCEKVVAVRVPGKVVRPNRSEYNEALGIDLKSLPPMEPSAKVGPALAHLAPPPKTALMGGLVGVFPAEPSTESLPGSSTNGHLLLRIKVPVAIGFELVKNMKLDHELEDDEASSMALQTQREMQARAAELRKLLILHETEE